jgi:malate synthase
MTNRIQRGDLQVSEELDKLITEKVCVNIDLEPAQFWNSFNEIVKEFTPRNKALLAERDDLQTKIDNWHKENKEFDKETYKTFLKEIGYWVDTNDDFEIETTNVDAEISTIAGAQLVVPVMNARFALNAANARWGSLYDALYGTDMISEDDGAERGGAYNPVRGDKVIEFSKNFMNENFPLSNGTYQEIAAFQIADGNLEITLKDQTKVTLADNDKFVGYSGDIENPTGILMKNNNLHVEVQIDREDAVGKDDLAGIKDILVESAVTTIQDCEDSVAAVDGEDKATVYSNWLGLMQGNLEETFDKGGKAMTRKLNPDRDYSNPEGEGFTLPGRSTMVVRNVGH